VSEGRAAEPQIASKGGKTVRQRDSAEGGNARLWVIEEEEGLREHIIRMREDSATIETKGGRHERSYTFIRSRFVRGRKTCTAAIAKYFTANNTLMHFVMAPADQSSNSTDHDGRLKSLWA
jgi:hypothetical protein